MTQLPEYFTTAKIIRHSISPDNIELITYELEYPRYIHAEIMTHRQFSRNAQSSRAVPVKEVLRINRENPVLPIVWGKNQPGMSSQEVLVDSERFIAEGLWRAAASSAFNYSEELLDSGLHKQYSNRLTEPFSRIKVVLTATEFDNFFWLRDDIEAAQPEIVDLARKMKKALDESTPTKLLSGEWHLPYVDTYRNSQGHLIYLNESGEVISLEAAKRISASCCAQVSYRKLDNTQEKAEAIYDRLFSGPKPHLSPTEHQATPVSDEYYERPAWKPSYCWPVGVTHVDREGYPWSGNFRGWIQYRQVL